MKQTLKAFIFFLGLLCLVGLGVCGSIILGGMLESTTTNNRKNKAMQTLEKNINSNSASAYDKWVYARLLTKDWAKDTLAPQLTDKQRTEKSQTYLQHAINNDVTEAMLYQADKLIMQDADNNNGLGLQGIRLLARAYKKGCESRYNAYPSKYNWNIPNKHQVSYMLKKALNKAAKSKSEAVRLEYASIFIYYSSTCDSEKRTQTNLITRLVENKQPLFHQAIDYVLALHVQQSDIATLIKQKVAKNNLAQFNNTVELLNNHYAQRFAKHAAGHNIKKTTTD